MASDGDDPLADAYNLMGAQGMTGPNPYLQFTGQIPMAGFYGAPTNAGTGAPIDSFTQAQQAHDAWQPPAAPAQGTTLNSTPTAASWDPRTGPQGLANLADKPVMTSAGGVIPTGQNTGLDHPQYVPASYAYPQGPAPQQQQAAPAPTNPIDMRQAYLDALSNPGKVNTPGAQILPGTSTTGPVGAQQPSVLQAFLQAHPGGGTSVAGKGGGGYTNQPFFSTLNQLQAGKGAAA